MSALKDLQSVFQSGLLHPAQAIPAAIIGNRRESAETMYGIYRHAYWSRLVESLGVDFPGLKALLGADQFAALARAYVRKHPSRFRSIRWLGRALAEFVEQEQPWCEDPWIADMAKLDWALAHAFDAADAPVVGLAELMTVPPEFWASLRLTFHPSLTRLHLQTPVSEVRPRLIDNESAAFDRTERRKSDIMTWRFDLDVKIRELPEDEATAHDIIRGGACFGDMCETLAIHGTAPEDAALRAAQILRGWLEWGAVTTLDHESLGSI